MKATERHHLKHNELADALGRASDYYAGHRRTLVYAIAGLVVLAIGIGGFFAWRQSVETRSRALLAEAMVVGEARVQAPAPPPGGTADKPGDPVQAPGTYPTEQAKLEAALPKLLAAADTYPTTDAGVTARYLAASTLVQLGRFDEAVAQYDRVIASGSGILANTARLGKAEAQLRSGQNDAAIAGFRELAERKDGDLPTEALLLELARAYRIAGKTEDARKTLTQVVEQHADSPAATEAKQELDKLPG
ncbi:MAG: tol-pal system YbgF family protein [Vicinamibacterales bacterium]